MEDKGFPIMNVATPCEVLIALYDVLEVTRFLWKKRQTLHRDISEGNVMVQKRELEAIPEELRAELEEMCFATALLGEDGPKPEADRLETPLLLIDFDVAQSNKPTPGKIPTELIQGTPYFMARAVRTAKVQYGYHIFPPMPELCDGATRYKDCVGQRLEQFGPNSPKMHKHDKSKSPNFFQHKLRYDAESVFWVLLWWSMQAKPLKDKTTNDFITQSNWNNFTGGVDSKDTRDHFIQLQDGVSGVCHPQYEPLEELLRDMVEQLKGDPEVLDDSDIRKHDEYLHEAFQRLIFDFLSRHRKAKSEFLMLEKSLKRRHIENEEPMKQPLPIITLPTTSWLATTQSTSGRSTVVSKRTRREIDGDGDKVTTRSTKRSRLDGNDSA
ncbi:hypothetical protein CPB86DRAFT_873657 [Serendipita vermifera]|nr:hypothetical protein CPB86DRAFT_873657 [Serendipita vermifera]